MAAPERQNPLDLIEVDEYLETLLEYFAEENFDDSTDRISAVSAGSRANPPFIVFRFLGENEVNNLDQITTFAYRYEAVITNDIRKNNIQQAKLLKDLMESYGFGMTILEEFAVEAKDTFAIRLFIYYND